MYIKLFINILVFCQFFGLFSSYADDFERLERGHFVIYHQNKDMANKLSWKAEYYYKKILGHFGVQEFRPWEGKDKGEIYLYKTKADYIKATGAPEWSGGIAQSNMSRFATYEDSPNLMTAIFPHELTHIMFHLFVGKKEMPLWLDEGMAQFEQEDDAAIYNRKRAIKWAIKNGSCIRLQDLLNMQAIPQDNVDLFYAESASLVDHLITDNIRTSYGKFVTYLKNGATVEEALAKAYQWKYKNGIVDLELRWKEFIKRKY
jgi:hypothetical protein